MFKVTILKTNDCHQEQRAPEGSNIKLGSTPFCCSLDGDEPKRGHATRMVTGEDIRCTEQPEDERLFISPITDYFHR